MKNPDYKPNNPFEAAIKRYLDGRAAEDPQFAESYSNPGKTIADCCKFIIVEVRKKNRTAFTNDEIYGLAVHYYDEADLGVIDRAPQCKVVIADDSPTEQNAPTASVSRPKPKARKEVASIINQTPSLFDL